MIRRSRRTVRTTPALGLLVAAALLLGACTSGGGGSGAAGTSGTTEVPAPPGTAATTTTAAPVLVPWTGPVEHLFFHTLVMRPDLAFTRGSEGQGFLDYFVTVGEFRKILDQLYANGWTLVDIHKAVRGQLLVPAGRKPLVLSEDDVNYYDNTRGHGVGWRLVLDPKGDVKVEVRDDQGTRVTDDDIVPIVDQFVAAHPDFSAEGAKGVITLTGYEGLFGERINQVDDPDHQASVDRARAIADRLKATGWTMASHSYGHIDLNRSSIELIRSDAEKWLVEATPIVGPTDVYIYAYGAAPRPGSPKVDLLRDLGFTIQCDIDKVPRLVHADGVDVMSRRHIDGIAFAQQGANLAGLFDVAAVEDTAARTPR
ncbi:MAG: polysaccharide deacetylase family protein [Acidimicrobiales bacterium]